MKKEELRKLKKLLVVIDMVNGFIREGAMADSYIETIIPEIERLVIETLNENEGVVFIKDVHKTGCREFKRYPAHCIIGTNEAELVDELIPYEKDALVYHKNSTSAFVLPEFQNDLRKMENLKELIFVGCCTDICDINLVIPTQNFFDQIDRDVNIIVPKNAVETFNSPTHNRDEWNEIAFKLMEQAGIQLVKKYNGRIK